MEPLIRDISDTARWVATFRADESERPDALFHDPYARKLAGHRGEQIANAITFSREHSWSFVARTVSFDELIKQHVEMGYCLIINLAAGLDTRPYRMSLPDTLEWVEIDLPKMIDYKSRILANETSNCELIRHRLDLADRVARKKLFSELNQECNKCLVVAEGLISYLNEKQAAELAEDLSAQPNFTRWLLDIMSPGLLRMAEKEMGSFLREGNAPLKFAPMEGEGFFLRYGWKNRESRSNLKVAVALDRLPEEMKAYVSIPEPEGPKGEMPWSGVCLFENIKKPADPWETPS